MDVGMDELGASAAGDGAAARAPRALARTATASGGHELAPCDSPARHTKRQRLEDARSELGQGGKLETELETLQICAATSVTVEHLRRRLEHALASEQQALEQLDAAASRHAEEALALRKKAAELEAELRVVDESMREWKHKALDGDAQLRSLTRQSRLEIQLLRDDLEAARVAAPASDRKDSMRDQVMESGTAGGEAQTERLARALADAQKEIAKLSRHLEQAEKQLAQYERRLGRGEYNRETTKVVHLAVNPTSELLQTRRCSVVELEALRKENEALRAQFEQLSGTSLSPIKGTPMSAVPKQKLTTTTSYETVEGLKLLNKRLKEVFAEQTQHYREAVYLLTGYKVDLRKSNGMELLRLRSVYADHGSDELLVKMEPSGALELLDTDFCAQINQGTLAYMTMCRSFPAFLAALTLQLFEKQTFQG